MTRLAISRKSTHLFKVWQVYLQYSLQKKDPYVSLLSNQKLQLNGQILSVTEDIISANDYNIRGSVLDMFTLGDEPQCSAAQWFPSIQT